VKTLLFFDDWLIQEYRGLDRRWFAAEAWPGVEPEYDPKLETSFCHPVVFRDPVTKEWRMWASGSTNIAKGDEDFSVFLYRSGDGLRWTPMACNPLADRLATPETAHRVFSGRYSSSGAAVFYDERETDAGRRYKLAYSEIQGANLIHSGANRIAVSPDGIRWTVDPEAVWREHVSDSWYNIVYNPYTEQYQFMARPIWGDRRIALYQTRDWKHFSRPAVVLHPDPADPPCAEFYGMPHFYYEGYFLGFLWRMHGAYDDYNISLRMKGRVDAELTYSVNGTHWNRTNRRPFLPDLGLGKYDVLNEYPSCMIVDDEGWIRVYNRAGLGEHDEDQTRGQTGFLTISRFRRDGFCAMETHSEKGFLALRPLVSRGGPITMNAIVSRKGAIRAELRKVPDNTPIPGYELANAVPVSGDGHTLALRWKTRDTIDSFKGEPFRVYLELDQARLYAVRVNADYLFASLMQPNLAGDYRVTHAMPFPWFTPRRENAYPDGDEP
jgi:hypothetical protein